MKSNLLTLGMAVLALTLPGSGDAEIEVDGVVGLNPPGESSCLAVEVTLGPGQSLMGLQWFHNDEMIDFPELLLMEGIPGEPPDLAETGMVLEHLAAESLAWGEVNLDGPVTSTTGTIYAVFVFPNAAKTGGGVGGGPAMGYRQRSGGRQAYISPDGFHWAQVHPEMEIAVDPILGAGQMKSAGTALADLKSKVSESGWTWRGGTAPEEEEEVTKTAQGPRLAVYPNPFNPRTEIRFFLEKPGKVTLDVYDVRGRSVNRLLAESLPAGEHQMVWEGVDGRGKAVASGVYWIQMVAGGQRHQMRVALLR